MAVQPKRREHDDHHDREGRVEGHDDHASAGRVPFTAAGACLILVVAL